MKEINLDKYGPIISDKGIGEEIFNLLIIELENDEVVTLEMSHIKSMATYCAKQIFGKLYLEIGSEGFFNKLIIKNASDDLKAIIKVGIQNALEERI